ncbi:MAG: SDR family oxidoreductase [Oscillospiraceae bacterium]
MVSYEQLFSIKGHTVVVTGATRGIGRGLAEHIADAGANVAVVSTNKEASQKVAAELAEKYGVRCGGFGCDVSDYEQVQALFADIEREMGLPDMLVNNAGITIHKPAELVTPEEWNRVIGINLTGAFYCCQAFARPLLERGLKGSIVITASNASHMVPTPQPQASYNASKAGVVMMAKSLANEWAKRGIRVNCLSPGYIHTDMLDNNSPEYIKTWINSIPVGRMGTPSELAGAVIYMLCENSGFITGSNITVDGGAEII